MPTASILNAFLEKNGKKSVVCLALLSFIFLSTCISKTKTDANDLRGPLYAGSDQCKNCHQNIHQDYSSTAHFNTTSDHLPNAIGDMFEPGKNTYQFNDSEQVVMEKIGSGFYQSYFRDGRKIFARQLDIIVGSGRKAQTYLYYNNTKKISQLPVSWFVPAHSWVNSPGFPTDHPKFDRNVPSYCLGCHSSFVGVKQTYSGVVMQEEFIKNQIIYGINCERCHGPARSHVIYHTDHPADKDGKFITKIRSLTRTQKNDLCALCHSGFRDVQQSLFNFKPGDNLANFYIPDFGRLDTANLDVHGNQTQLMLASKCYRLSNDLTCTSCHDVHVKERDNLAIFSKRCASCHQQVKHSFTDTSKSLGAVVQNNCIDCHMPLKASNAITLKAEGKSDAWPDYIRTHLIAIYPHETKKFLRSVRLR